MLKEISEPLSPIVSASWLKNNLGHDQLVILDASPETNVAGLVPEYPNIQIPGARPFDVKGSFCNKEHSIPNMLPSPKQFETNCQKLGINNDSIIIVYDNLGVYMSPRVKWMFNVMGHQKVAVLNGGLSEWKDSGFLTEPTTSGTYNPGNFKAHFRNELVADSELVNNKIKDSDVLILDARSRARFYGQSPEPRTGIRSGHIPGSINLPFKEVLRYGKFKTKDELTEILSQLRIKDQSLIFSCGSGITACIIMLAADLVNPNAKAVYDGSWSEWGMSDKLPVEI